MIRFTKMHGLGNDYVYVDRFALRLDGVDAPGLARAVSDRHRGVGSDGLILIGPPSHGAAADVRMEMYNADGSRGEMCGNGIRCVAKYAVERGLVRDRRTVAAAGTQGLSSLGFDEATMCADDQTRTTRPIRSRSSDDVLVRIETDRGVLELTARATNGVVSEVRVDMGPPILRPADIPVTGDGDSCVRMPLDLGGVRLDVTCVSMGNPHAVAFVDDVHAFDLARLGPLAERHPVFPRRVNFHVARADGRTEATMRTWERGSGITQACGTGACAVLVAGVLEGRLDRAATVRLPGGDLFIEWPETHAGEAGSVFMTGPAVEVFSGEWPLEPGDVH